MQVNGTNDAITLQTAQARMPDAVPGFDRPGTAVEAPAANERVTVSVQPGDQIRIQFDPAAAQVSADGDNLVLTFRNGGQVILEGFVTATATAAPPALILPNGTLLPADVIAVQLGAGTDLGAVAEAGPAATGGGANRYNDDLGEVIDLLRPQDVLPPTALAFSAPETLEAGGLLLAETEDMLPSEEEGTAPVQPSAEGVSALVTEDTLDGGSGNDPGSPDAGSSVSGAVSISSGSVTYLGYNDALGSATQSPDGLAWIADDGSWAMTIDAAGNFVFTLNAPLDHALANQVFGDDTLAGVFIATVSASGGSTEADITVSVNDDGPAIRSGQDGAYSHAVSETNLAASTAGDAGSGLDAVPTSVSGNFFAEVSFGADGEGALTVIAIGGTSVAVTSAPDQVITSADLGEAAGLWQLTVNVGGVAGAYTFELLDNTTAHSGTGATGARDTVPVPDIVATVTDGDGDGQDVSLTIAIEDDGPVAIGADYARIAHPDGVPVGTASGELHFTAGGDGLATVNPFTFDYANFVGDGSNVDANGLKVTDSNGIGVLFSDGSPIYYAVRDGLDGYTVFGNGTGEMASTTELVGVVYDESGAVAEEIFSITLNADGTYDMSIGGRLDAAAGPVEIPLTDGISGGNASFYAIGTGTTDTSADDVLIEPADGGVNTTVNSRNGGLGAGGGSDPSLFINAGEGLKLQFVEDLTVIGSGGNAVPSHGADRTLNGATLTVGDVHSNGTANIFLAGFTVAEVSSSAGTVVGFTGFDPAGGADLSLNGALITGLSEGDTFTIQRDAGFEEIVIWSGEGGGNGFALSNLSFSIGLQAQEIEMSFAYTVTDGDGDTSVASIGVTVDPQATHLDDNDNTYTVATSDGEAVYAEGGNDTVTGAAGNDVLVGGEGNDTLSGLAGDDILVGSSGDDNLLGGDGADRLFGNAGADTLDGGAGSDELFGDSGDDLLVWNAADDVIDGGPGNDTLRASGDDDIDLSSFVGTLAGIEQIDLVAGSGSNTVTLNVDDVLQSDTDVLTVLGDNADTVEINTANWTEGATSDGFVTYSHGIQAATLLVATEVQVQDNGALV